MLNFILGLLIGGVGVWFIKSRLDSRLRGNDKGDIINPEQVAQKQENLRKVLEMAQAEGEISNDDVQEALNVSDATATRYLEELEQQGKLEQIGERGRQVIYRVK